MRIAYLSTFYPLRGGIAQFNSSLYRAFEHEHEIKAFTFKRQYPDLLFPGKSQYVQESDKVDPIPSEEILDTINPLSYQKTAKKIQEFQPDILLMKYWMSYFAPSLGWVAKKLKKQAKVISVMDNVIPHEKRFFDVPLTKFFLKQNSGFIIMSKSVENDLLYLYPNARYIRKMHPIYNHFGEPINKQEARKVFGIPKDKKVLLFFGFIRDYKGLDLLIEAFGNLSKDYHLIIAGESYGSFEKYKQLIDKSPNKENIHPYVEYIADYRVPYFFSAADVCILPYKSATQSGITNISYHFNLPLLATDTGSLRETIQHKQTGLIVDKPKEEELVKGIEEFFQLNEKIDFVKKIEILKKELSWESFAHAIINFARQL
ncbi:MAG: glycosyltransferase [bacterium]